MKCASASQRTWYGDSNLDDVFNSGDLVEVLAAGEYEEEILGNSGWSSGDWDGDGDFATTDLVTALADGGYEQGPRAATRAVPEPCSTAILLVGLGILRVVRCHRISSVQG